MVEIPCTGFDWDKGNNQKNWIKHQVSMIESEEVFFNKPLLKSNDVAHSSIEKRYYVLGKTNLGRNLFQAYTIRNNQIRIICARDMTKREKEI